MREGARTACFIQEAWEEGWEEAGKMEEEVEEEVEVVGEEGEAVEEEVGDSLGWVQDRTTRRPEEC